MHSSIVKLVESTDANILVPSEYDGDEQILIAILHNRAINYFATPILD
jgi:hypothetical protein